MSEITGQLFRLAKSGPQGGSDVRAVGSNTIKIGLEGKRYAEKTHLGLDELRAKLFDAAVQDDPVDLWILATTREISASDHEQLSKSSVSQGIAALVLDWPAGQGVLPDLAVLCAEAPNAIAAYIGTDAVITTSIAAIRAHSNFDKFRDRLRNRLTAADIGYAAATVAMCDWMRAGLQNQPNAGTRLGGRGHDLLASPETRIARKALSERLDQWLANSRLAVLIGNEGVGKSWSFLSWWIDRSQQPVSLPLTIFVSAKDIRDETVEELISRLLATRLQQGDRQFWQHRLDQWRRAEAVGPQLILVIDGLNQNWMKRDWADFVQPLFDQRWLGRIAVLMTCWPDHWAELHKLAPLTPEPVEIPVTVFSNEELDLLLSRHHLSRESFTEPMLALMRVPRLSLLAITRQKELAESGDITPERLAYEDWKNRILRRGSALAIGDGEFQDFVRDIGTTLRKSVENSAFTRRDLLDRLGRDSGKERKDLLETLGEIVAGRWLEPGKRAHEFRVNPELTPFVLGLTLAHELKQAPDDGPAAAIIAGFVDPFKGQTLGVAILRAASTIALLDPEVGRGARRAILKRWLAEQNFMQVDFDAYWRLIGLDVDLICQNVEETWLSKEGSGSFSDEILIKGMVQAYRFPQVASHLVPRAEQWLGWLWEDPDEGRFLGRIDPSSKRSIENRARTKASLAKWQNRGSHEWPRIELRTSGDVSWFSHRVFGILSFLPRAPFIRAFTAWGLSRAVMGVPRHLEELAWVLRLNNEDPEPFELVFYEWIERLRAVGNGIANEAANYLLEAIADPRAQGLLGRSETSETESDGKAAQAAWADPRNPFQQPGRDSHKEHVSGRLLWLHHRQNGDEDIRFKNARISLARLEPAVLQEVAVEAVRSASDRTPEQLWGLVHRAHSILMLLTAEERHVLVEAIDSVLGSGKLADEKELLWWRARRLEVRLWDASASEQLTIITKECRNATELALLDGALPQPDQTLLRNELAKFPLTGTKAEKLVWLYYLRQRAADETLRGWSGLAALISDEDEDVGRLAIELAAATREPSVMEAVAASGRDAKSAGNRLERAHVSRALLAASEVLGRPDLLKRADPEVVALQAIWHPTDTAILHSYDMFLRAALGDSLVLRSGPVGDHWVRHEAAMRALISQDSNGFLPWLTSWLSEIDDIPHLVLMDEFPLIALCRMLFEAGAQQAEVLWDKLTERMAGGIVKNQSLALMPMKSPVGENGDRMRTRVLSSATTDQDLAALVQAALKNGHAGWLERVIRDGEASGRAGEIAKAYTLLGYSDAVSPFISLWEDFSGREPNRGWLASVYQASHTTFELNRWARHWYCEYLKAPDPAAAFAAFGLLLSCLDGRASLWIKTKSELAPAEGYLKAHWDSNVHELNDAIKNSRDKLKKTLFHTAIMEQTQHPWL
ncbi:hypothetical protein [Mesorhizobium captivum]|uniref:hypothetical protein n=1 Tax=Mesorhizobium captivum TaxID=3072319 RepID=UPI002A24CB2D|nr:hypothetical protein [Mesorhizobium sp. VK22E]MDX8508622.1 hypothetical protein [Mesorhizobium sp. VK22E]